MIPIQDAITIIARETTTLGTERVPLEDCVGRILAEEIVADLDLPPFDRSQMDGFAVISNATPASLRIVGESVAGRGFDRPVSVGEAVRIMTGARVPAGADAVEQVERTRESDGLVEIREPLASGRNIVKQGAEVRAGDLVFRPGEIITDRMIAALASFGYESVAVGKLPSVAVLATGSEIVDVSETPGPDQIRNSNSPMLKGFLRALGIEAVLIPPVNDDLDALESAITAAERNGFDILILTGGVSVGVYDFTKPAMRELGAGIFFEKVALKPGKPTVFGKLGEMLVFGLPGNPVSVAVTFSLFVRFAILLMQEAALPELRRGTAVAAGPIRGARERDCLLPVSLETDGSGRLMIESLRFSGSSNFIAFARAEALVHIPKGSSLEAGQPAEIYFL